MAEPASITEKSARRISPLFFAAAIAGFFLTFAGVSCNTTTAKTLIGSAGQGFGANPAQVTKTNQCLDALNGYNFATYTGINLAFGTTPSLSSSAPAACQGINPSGSTQTTSDADQAKVGMQPPELIGLIVVALGLLASLVFFVRSPGSRPRALITTLLAAAGVALVVVGQTQISKAVTDKIAGITQSQTANSPFQFNISDYLNVNPGAGFFIVVAVLGVALILNLFAAVAPAGGDGRLAAATPGGPSVQGSGLGPPAQPAWPGAPGSSSFAPGEPPPPPPPAEG